ncbi:MAG: glycosyltransferase family 39 protein, partial [Acidobacteriota bacterium]|nr:glycosyltransferase family 39 protein [Acidobacteriota bacterium]
MSVETRELLYSAGERRPASRAIAPARRITWRRAAVFAGLFALVILLQYLSGAYRSEFADYPDEPAHYVTARMVHDFLLSGNYEHPIKFAQDYYSRYPKVAFGHWPPLLYVIQALWMLIFSSSRASILMELALTTTFAAFATYSLAAKRFGIFGGVLAAAALVCLPVIQMYADQEMAESLLLLTSLWAAVYFTRFLDSGRWQDSLWFALLASCAILTKGNGWALAMVPPFAILLTRNFSILKKPAFWLPVPVIAVLCIPWQLLTFDMVHRGWMGGDEPGIHYTAAALVQFIGVLQSITGWGIAGFAALGVAVRVGRGFLTKRIEALDAVMLS